MINKKIAVFAGVLTIVISSGCVPFLLVQCNFMSCAKTVFMEVDFIREFNFYEWR